MKIDRQLTEIERKATALESKILATKLDIAEKRITGEAGRERLEKLQTETLRVNYERAMVAEQQQELQARRQAGPMFAPIVGAGRFMGRRALGMGLKFGGIAAGALGTYSIISNVFKQLGTAEQINEEYAKALSVTRGRQTYDYGRYQNFFELDRAITENRAKLGFDYTKDVIKPFFEFEKVLKGLGQTVWMTAKDMIPMLDVAKELGDFTGGRRGTLGGQLVELVNIGKQANVEPGIISGLITGGLREGGFVRGGQYPDIVKMILMNQNMMHRAAESLQAMNQVMSSTVHGTTGLNAFGIFNLLDTLNRSEFLAYRGAGGSRALMDIDRAFRSGGNQNLQYFQALALNPAMQSRNAEMLREWETKIRIPTDYKTGSYDQLIADFFKELGAFATPADVVKQLKGLGFESAAEYVEEQYTDQNKMNIERVMDQYRIAYGAENEGRRLFMTSQLAKDLGISFSDVGVLNKAMKDEIFMEHARKGKFTTQEMTDLYTKFVESGRQMPVLEAYRKEKAEKTTLFLDTARAVKEVMEKTLPTFLKIGGPALKTIADNIPIIAEGINSVVKFLFPEEKTIEQETEDLKKRIKEMEPYFTFPEFIENPPVATENINRMNRVRGVTAYGLPALHQQAFFGFDFATMISNIIGGMKESVSEGSREGVRKGMEDSANNYPVEPGDIPLYQ
ncbi:MAG: hypothetical protein JSU85_03540 [Candidatus Zixiibacteriota bacterium]|nr:MAG: hypothetical protein JSU85_03540 [candidate division Zixibacteria bacterium]